MARFIFHLETEVLRLEEEIRSRIYRPLPYRTFMVHDPKDRRICAADFRDRVVHHAACKSLDPLLESKYIYDTYACRREKGTHRAVRRAQAFARRHDFFLKLDIHKFFDSVDHEVLKAAFRKCIKDPDFLRLLDIFVDHPVPWCAPGKGIPIGNLTSQHFANFYLDPVDHFIKEKLRLTGYLRYMDDLVLFADEKRTLWKSLEMVRELLERRLLLSIKKGSVLLAPVYQGIPFLGMRIFPSVVRIDRAGWRRFRRKVMSRERDFSRGFIDEEALTRSMSSLVGHLKHENTRNLRANFLERPGAKEARTG